MLYQVIKQYCKLQKIQCSQAGNTFFLNKHKKRVATIKIGSKDIQVETNERVDHIEETKFIDTLKADITQTKILNRFKNTSQPKKWKKTPHRNKITERGKAYLYNYARNQNGGYYVT